METEKSPFVTVTLTVVGVTVVPAAVQRRVPPPAESYKENFMAYVPSATSDPPAEYKRP